MRRKAVGIIVALTLGVLVASLAADIQQPEKVYRIGWLGVSSGLPRGIEIFLFITDSVDRECNGEFYRLGC